MKIGGLLCAGLLAAIAGCAGAPQWPSGSAPRDAILAELHARSYSADELGIQMAGEPGSQTIRWRETIRPRTPVTVPLLPHSERSAQPRVMAALNGGAPLPVSVDSGAAVNLVDARLALRNGVKVADPKTFGNVFQGLGGEEFSYYGMFDAFTIGELRIEDLFSVLRLPDPAHREQVDNLLGVTTLAKFSYITLDFPARRATFALDGDYSPARPIFTAVPFTLQSLQLVLDLQINGQYEVTVALDTGNDAELMLTEEMIAALQLTEAAAAGEPSRFLGIGGIIETRSFEIERISLGGRQFAAVETTVVPNHFPPSLGSGFLRQFRATLDFKARKLWLE